MKGFIEPRRGRDSLEECQSCTGSGMEKSNDYKQCSRCKGTGIQRKMTAESVEKPLNVDQSLLVKL